MCCDIYCSAREKKYKLALFAKFEVRLRYQLILDCEVEKYESFFKIMRGAARNF